MRFLSLEVDGSLRGLRQAHNASVSISNIGVKRMKTERPVNLNLLVFRFPLAAIVSITHRITGVILFAGVAFALYAFDLAVASEQGFVAAKALVAHPLGMFVLLGLIATLTFHIVAGLKHLLMDFHVGDTVEAAFYGSIAVIVLTIVITGAVGVTLW